MPNACHVSQTQKVSDATYDYLWSSIGVDPSGNVGIVASAVNSNTAYLSIVAFSHFASQPPGMLVGPAIVSQGTTPFNCSLGGGTAQTGNPAGVATVRDPLDAFQLWVSEQYANDSNDCHWNTRIIEYQLGP
jgi:hypothetical protein